MNIDGLSFLAPDADISHILSDKNFVTEISPNDEMFDSTEKVYYWVGATAKDSIKSILTSINRPESSIKEVMDLPCGWGRVARYLRFMFPESNLTVCDIQRDGVDFCAKHFNAVPVYSKEDINEVVIDNKFDLIWVGSLFTHLAPESWINFFKYLPEHLTKDGLLIFTITGDYVYNLLTQGELLGISSENVSGIISSYESNGFAYSPYTSERNLHSNYGRAFVSKQWVMSQIEKIPGLEYISYVERGYGRRQDVIACRMSK